MGGLVGTFFLLASSFSAFLAAFSLSFSAFLVSFSDIVACAQGYLKWALLAGCWMLKV